MLAERHLPLHFQFLRGTEATVSLALVEQLLCVLLIDIEARALAVGGVRTADLRPLGPVQPEPAQVFDQLRFVAHLAPLHIGVFDPKQERSAGVPGKEPVVERGAGIAHVQHTGRRGSKAHPRRRVCHKSVLMLSSGSIMRSEVPYRKCSHPPAASATRLPPRSITTCGPLPRFFIRPMAFIDTPPS